MFKIDINKKLSKEYNPKFFNSNAIETLLKENENKVILVLRSGDNLKAYEIFDKDFSAYLEKLPQTPMKRTVGSLFNKQMVFYGTAKSTDITTLSRVLITKNEKLAGIVLNAYSLDISVSKGETPQIDEAIYATYSGLIRAGIIINKQEVRKDYELHKLISSYIFLLFLKILGRYLSITPQQKLFLHVICVYLFYKQFMEEKHVSIIKIIQKQYVGDIIDKTIYETFEDNLEKLMPFTSFKDFPRVVQDLNLATVNAQQVLMLMIKSIDKQGFYSLIGSLDSLVSIILLSKYPTELISRGIMVNNEIQEKIEQKVEKLINKISYDNEFNNVIEKIKK